MDDSDRDASSSANESDDEPKAAPASSGGSRSSSRSNSESDGGNASSAESQRSPPPTTNDTNGKSPENSGDEGGSESDRMSDASNGSASSRGSRAAHKNANLEDGNSSDSSESSVDSSSRKNKNYAKNVDTQPEEISDGDIESDNEKADEAEKKPAAVESSLAHDADDLSDVSDLDESIGGHSEPERPDGRPDTPKGGSDDERSQKMTDKTHRPEEGEEQLDFEAEDGECGGGDAEHGKDGKEEKANDGGGGNKEENKDGADKARKDKEEPEEGEELEEGEVTDEDEARPEETEPRPVCRFFSRGQCTWGASCRFLHPGVTDKGNYTMFEMIRPVVPGEYGRDDRSMYGRPEQPLVESAWERGLRTAKEMLRKSIKRKEQDIDFEEKKMNLSLAQEELDKENGYYARVPSPEPRYVRHPVPVEYTMSRVPPEEYYSRRQVLYEPEYAPRDRRPMYREMPPHRPQPDYHYEEEMPKARRPKREVIVQRAVEERPTRGDEWSDPWMRSKSPGTRKGAGKRSYSSGSSYSSSSSSRSSSRSSRSSYRSRSRSPRHRRSSRGARGGGGGGPSGRGRHGVSPSVIVSERKAASERAALMNPPAPRKKAPSPGMMRAGAQNPPAPSSRLDGRTRKLAVAAALARVKSRRRSSRSSSGSSSGSSSSDSDSSSSSSSSREASPPRRAPGVDLALAMKVKAIDALKVGAEKRPIKLTLKTPVGRKVEPAQGKTTPSEPSPIGGGGGKKRPATSPPPADKAKKAAGNGGGGSGATSRREELLKQLKAVEDAIAKKRSKVN